jgi:uncharacterized protein YciI
MLFSIHCMDRAGALQARLENYAAHRAHLNSTSTTIVLAGPVAAEDAETPVGSMFVIDAKDRAEAEAFNREDPFYKLGIWDRDSIRIHPLLKRRGWLAGY